MSVDQSVPSKPSRVFFERRELDSLVQLYGRMVAAGEWRDYALDGLSDRAVFSIFRRSAEAPLYRVEKRPDLAQRQGAWAVIGPGDMVLRRGHDLKTVLRVFEAKRFSLAVDSKRGPPRRFRQGGDTRPG